MAMLSDAQLNSLNKDALVFIASSLQEQISSMQAQLDNANAQIAENNKQIKHLIEQISLLNQHKFGRSSEKASDQCDGQLTIYDVFNEAEGLKKPDLPEPTIQEITVGSHSRKKKSVGKREEDLSELPKRIIPHEIPEEELNKLFPNGYKELPIESYQRLSIIPETFIVDEHQVHVYAAKDNSGKIVRAPRSTDLFRNSIATSPLLSSVITGKFANAIPIERQVKIFKVLLKEMQSLGLDVQVQREDGTEVEMTESIDYGDTELRAMLEGDRHYNDRESYSNYGYQEQEFKNNELVNVESDSKETNDDYTDDLYDAYTDDSENE